MIKRKLSKSGGLGLGDKSKKVQGGIVRGEKELKRRIALIKENADKNQTIEDFTEYPINDYLDYLKGKQ